jgi:hypothetical protein
MMGGNRVAVGLIADNDPAEGVAGRWVQHLEDGAEVGRAFDHVRGRFNASRAASMDA